MHVYNLIWNDADKNRDIELKIRYRYHNYDDRVEVMEVVPTGVILFESCGESIFKTLPVHTETGRKVLVRAFEQAHGDLSGLEQEIHAWHCSSDDEVAV